MKKKSTGAWITAALGELARALGAVIAWCTVGTFVIVTIVSIVWKMDPSIQVLDVAAASLPSQVYTDMIGMEMSLLSTPAERSPFSPGSVASFLTRLTTGIDPSDPRTFAAGTLPGAEPAGGIVIIRGIGTAPNDHPVEVAPSPDLWEAPNPAAVPDDTPPPAEQPLPDPVPGPNPPDGPASDPSAEPQHEATPGNVVFVYHSHPEESFLPELDGVTKVDRAFDKTDQSKTVTAVGKRMTETLQGLGIGALHSDQYYPWESAYDGSRQTVKAAMGQHQSLRYLIDIHRDSARADKTKLTHNGVTYAKLYFVIGQKNPDYKQNEALAAELHRRVEEKMLGLSRGVFLKHAGSNGEFNQSLSPGSILVEVGGVDNTLEECFRTIDILAEVVAEMYWDDAAFVKADAALPDSPSPPENM